MSMTYRQSICAKNFWLEHVWLFKQHFMYIAAYYIYDIRIYESHTWLVIPLCKTVNLFFGDRRQNDKTGTLRLEVFATHRQSGAGWVVGAEGWAVGKQRLCPIDVQGATLLLVSQSLFTQKVEHVTKRKVVKVVFDFEADTGLPSQAEDGVEVASKKAEQMRRVPFRILTSQRSWGYNGLF